MVTTLRYTLRLTTPEVHPKVDNTLRYTQHGAQGGIPSMVHREVYHSGYTRRDTPWVYTSPTIHLGYTLGIHHSPLMHAATQWSEQCRGEEPWAQLGE